MKKLISEEYFCNDDFIQLAIDEARDGITHNHGGPFGAVIVKDGKIVGRGHNMVLFNKDSTAHGEIMAIRNAEQNLDTYDLSGCVLYTTGEPCPMCLAACMWANIKHVFYGCTIADNAMIGFRDEAFDKLFGGREAFANYLSEESRDKCLQLFADYNSMNPTLY